VERRIAESLAGRVALVTGGTGGIGRALVERLAHDGAAVVAVDRDEARGADLVAALRRDGLEVAFERGDVSVGADCRRVVAATVERYGRLDVVVNMAAILRVESVEESSEEAWDEVLRTNLTSAFLVSKAAIPHLRGAGGGSIVNISSVHSQATVERVAAYAAAKGGLVALSRQMANDLAVDRIRVNAVVVGGVATDMSRQHLAALGRPVEEFDLNDRLLGRVARPEEVAAAIRFLVGSDASFVNGSAFVVDGGMLAKLAMN
jgi:NAD(P)-dependent dehydrogenase (short-subunit alcohol dehydrogenase family)